MYVYSLSSPAVGAGALSSRANALSHWNCDVQPAAGRYLLYCVWRNSTLDTATRYYAYVYKCMYVCMAPLELDMDALSQSCNVAELVSEVRQLRLDVGAAVQFSVKIFFKCPDVSRICN